MEGGGVGGKRGNSLKGVAHIQTPLLPKLHPKLGVSIRVPSLFILYLSRHASTIFKTVFK